MLVFFRAFAPMFAFLFAVMGYGAFSYARDVDTIAKNPAFVTTDDYFADSQKEKGGNRREYMLIYSYRVNGQLYQVRTGWMSETKKKEFIAAPVQVAYSPSAPGRGMFKTRYDAFKAADRMPGALMAAFFKSLAIAFCAGLVLVIFSRGK